MSDYEKLQEKYKKKCAKIKELNKKVDDLQERLAARRSYEHAKYLKALLMNKLTSHLSQHYYRVEYLFDGKKHHTARMLSFGPRWIELEVCIYLARESDLILYGCDIQILDIKKLE